MKIALYGYDTIVGKLVLEALEEDSNIKLDAFYPLTPIPGDYDAVPVQGKNYPLVYVDEFDFSQAQVAIFLTTKDETARLTSKVQNAGCILIDNSHLYAVQKDAPLVLREVQGYVNDVIAKRLACVPLATSSEIVLSLNPLHDEYGLKKAVVTALISASEHGELGTQTLAHETTLLLNGMSVDVTDFPAQLAFNIHTRIGELDENGISEHEHIILHEVERLLDINATQLALTCIQVPTFYGHTLSVHVELEEDCSLEDFKAALKQSAVLSLEEELQDKSLVSPVSCAELDNKLYIARIRKFARATFDFTVVMDNTRHGEATAVVDILHLLQAQL